MEDGYDPLDNPLYFRAHPLLAKTLSVWRHPEALSLNDAWVLLAVYAIALLPWALTLRFATWRAMRVRMRFGVALLGGLPLLFAFFPLVTTLLDDVIRQQFTLQHRWLFLLSLFTSVQMAAVIYAFFVRKPMTRAIDWQGGYVVTLAMLLASVALGGLFLLTDLLFHLF